MGIAGIAVAAWCATCAASFAVPRSRARVVALRLAPGDDFDMDANKANPSGTSEADGLDGPIDLSEEEEDFDLEKYMAENPLGDFGSQMGGFDPYGGGEEGGPTEGGGAGYVWQQTKDTLSVAVPVPEGTTAKQVVVDYPTRSSVVVSLKGEAAPRVGGELAGDVVIDESFWSLEEARDDGTRALVLDVQKAAGSRDLWHGFLDAEGDAAAAAVTSTCYFDVDVDGAAAGRVEIGVFGDDTPKTADNFLALCRGVDVDGATYSYAGEHNVFHRVIPGFMCQGGDVTSGDGTGGVSIYGGAAFDDEAFPFRHVGEGILSMANSGPNSNKSQFFITLGDCTWLDGKHVIFGRVTAGMDVVRKIEALGSPQGTVSGSVKIAACGVL